MKNTYNARKTNSWKIPIEKWPMIGGLPNVPLEWDSETQLKQFEVSNQSINQSIEWLQKATPVNCFHGSSSESAYQTIHVNNQL